MKHCNGCSCSEEREFNGLMCRPIEQLGVAFRNIKIPDGWRIPTVQEAIDLVNNDDFFKWSKFGDQKHDFYVQQPFKRNEGKLAAWFGCYSNNFWI